MPFVSGVHEVEQKNFLSEIYGHVVVYHNNQGSCAVSRDATTFGV